MDGTRTVTGLTAPATPLIGREDEIERVVALISDPAVRIVTITGPGGAGKTRLSLAIVERVADPVPRFDDLRAGAHNLAEYRETALRADESDDPRIRAFHAGLQGIAGGAAGTAIVYGARRITPENDLPRRGRRLAGVHQHQRQRRMRERHRALTDDELRAEIERR